MVERGVISLALQLLQVVQPHPNKLAVADTTGRIIQLLVFLLQTKQSWQSKVPNLDIPDPEAILFAILCLI